MTSGNGSRRSQVPQSPFFVTPQQFERVRMHSGGTARWVLVASDDATLSTVAGALGLAG